MSSDSASNQEGDKSLSSTGQNNVPEAQQQLTKDLVTEISNNHGDKSASANSKENISGAEPPLTKDLNTELSGKNILPNISDLKDPCLTSTPV